MRPTRASPIVVAAALVMAIAVGTRADARRVPREPSTGLRGIAFAKPPPDFPIPGEPTQTHLRALAGRPVVVNFWATWCEPCRAELDAFARLRETYGDRVALVTISDEAPGVARAALAARHLDATVVDDPGRAIFDRYAVGPIPVTLVLTPDQTVRYVSIGQLDWLELRAAVDPLVHLTPPAESDKVKGNAGTPAS